METKHKRRLEKLADGLERVPTRVFNFESLVSDGGKFKGRADDEKWIDEEVRRIDSNPQELIKCGYAGCAIGFLPFIFPRQFAIREQAGEMKVEDRENAAQDIDAAQFFFGLSEQAVCHLFIPGSQDTEIYGGKMLDAGTTPKQVAKNIRAFIETSKPQK